MIKMGFNKGFVNDKCKKEHNKKFKCLFMGMKKIAVVNLAAAGAMITIPGLFSDCNVMANQKVKLSIGKNKLVNKSKYGYLQVATQKNSNSQGYRSVNSRKMTTAYHLPSSYGSTSKAVKISCLGEHVGYFQLSAQWNILQIRRNHQIISFQKKKCFVHLQRNQMSDGN